MISKIDWISFSVPVEAGGWTDEREAFYAAGQALYDLHENLPELLFMDEGYVAGNGRSPYRNSWKWLDNSISLFTHPNLNHALVEISGDGCAAMDAVGVTDTVLRSVRDRLTRLDIACDMPCSTSPTAFVAKRQEGRFKAHSEMVSEQGETCYVGSRTSDRYARVYRYNPPHERAHLLRCEYVVKGNNARLTCDALLGDGSASVAVALGEAFGWQHPDWKPGDISAAEIVAWRPERRAGKTLFWLADTVAPLLVRLHHDKTIDLEEWLDLHVRPKINRV